MRIGCECYVGGSGVNTRTGEKAQSPSRRLKMNILSKNKDAFASSGVRSATSKAEPTSLPES